MIATSSTESEFMVAYKLGKMLLYVLSILWDLNVPQEAASRLYKDNNACTAMVNAQKPTSRTDTWIFGTTSCVNGLSAT